MTEGYRPLDSGTPLRRAARATSPSGGGFDEALTKAEASKRIDALQEETGRGR
nr:DUF3072 domain-containing protein [Sphingomonas vulcanisoli]